MSVFYALSNVPVHSVLLLTTREAALDFPRGDIRLGFCDHCGFISNVAYEPALQDYSSQYEATQAYSSTFTAFARDLATRLIERYDLHGKQILEIGCGEAEFLALLCELGDNRGLGYDPSFVGDRISAAARERLTVIPEYFTERHMDVTADFVCCQMTLEHIEHTDAFVRTVASATRNRPETVVFFQVPDVTRVLQEIAFWDVYYEHCSYFSPASLAHLFRANGFDILDLRREYDDQYLMIEARPASGQPATAHPLEDDLTTIADGVRHFGARISCVLQSWRDRLQDFKRDGRRVVLWGSGSKGVAFLTTLDLTDEVAYTVDVNPHKHGTFMAGTGHEIVGPDVLVDERPDVVIIMNPIYRNEIERDLARRGLAPEILTV
jgi:2-polyprenyl-3-methyl-5-hydroxy-6-metoxy-1,4-benzoquinol methylase